MKVYAGGGRKTRAGIISSPEVGEEEREEEEEEGRDHIAKGEK